MQGIDTKTVMGDKKTTQKGQVIQYCFHMEKQGYAGASAR
jgi:hypothetical protein